MKTLIDSNFRNFQTSVETRQKELSSSQLAKIEENIFGSYTFKRHGNEAQYRGNAQVITKLMEADASLDSANLSVENINTARTKIGEESVDLKNNRSSLENVEFVSSEIESLLAKNCISEVSTKPSVVNPLTVAYNRSGNFVLVRKHKVTASDVGYGGYINPTVQRSDKSSSQQGEDIVLQKDIFTVSGSWSQKECNKSST
uniref:Uncharacterized protein n=1 Tax=Magallana gigas TaxID=29159 RepID=A0A8W8NCE5_MAGGI